jgi:hypothetical protein
MFFKLDECIKFDYESKETNENWNKAYNKWNNGNNCLIEISARVNCRQILKQTIMSTDMHQKRIMF